MLTNNNNQITIPANPNWTNAQNYDFLWDQGMAYLQSLGGNIWTDFNEHDPGITIMELLCYAINDLAYRTAFDIPDILYDPQNYPNNMPLFSAANILTTSPVTILDYRKFLIDRVPGVRNVTFYIISSPYTVYDGEQGGTVVTANIYPDPYIQLPPDILNGSFSFSSPPQNPSMPPLVLNGLYGVRVELEDFEVLSGSAYTAFLNKIMTPWTPPGVTTASAAGVSTTSGSASSGLTGSSTGSTTAGTTSSQLNIPAVKQAYKNYVYKLLMENRNLCEDFATVGIMEIVYIAICADIELTPTANATTVYTSIYNNLYNFVSPSLSFYTIGQLQARGKTIDQIFEGPEPTRGFADVDELAAFKQRTVIYASDLIKAIMSIDGVEAVMSLHMSSYDSNGNLLDEAEQYCIHLPADNPNVAFRFPLDMDPNYPVRDDNNDPLPQMNKIVLYRGPIKVPVFITINNTIPTPAGTLNIDSIINTQDFPAPPLVNDLPIPLGNDRQIENYYSIQNEFPLVYMLGQEGADPNATDIRLAQRLQLKSYLLLFEQLLSDYLAQLDNIKTMIGFNKIPCNQSYFFQALDPTEILDLDKLYVNGEPGMNKLYGTAGQPGEYDRIIEGAEKNDPSRFDRYSRLADRMLAIFGEDFSAYSLLKYLQNDLAYISNEDLLQQLVVAKREFLQNYAKISQVRTKGFNYTRNFLEQNVTSPYDTGVNVSGFELRLYNILGLDNPGFHYLEQPFFTNSEYTVYNNPQGLSSVAQASGVYEFADLSSTSFSQHFGLHLVEHILLRPRQSEAQYDMNTGSADLRNQFISACIESDGTGLADGTCFCNDPYSFRASIVIPGWNVLSMDTDFRTYVETTIRQEAPAHVALKICWVSPVQMYLYEYYYLAYMQQLKIYHYAEINGKLNDATCTAFTKALKDFINILNSLQNIYPPSFLNDCDDTVFGSATPASGYPIILDSTNIDNNDPDYVFYSGAYPPSGSGATIETIINT